MQDTPHSTAPGAKRKRRKKPTAPPAGGHPPAATQTGTGRPFQVEARQAATAPVASQSLAVRLWAGMRSEPALMVTTAYLFVSFIGIWANYWFFRRFGLPILEYMQGGDYLVAGLRDPVYAYAVIGIAAVSLLIVWAEKWRARHPDRVRQLTRSWWGRILVGKGGISRGWYLGMSRETGLLVLSFITAMMIVFSYVDARARQIHDGGGHVVRVSLAGQAAPLPGQARLLGTNSNFVFLWWPQQRRVEALPTANVSRIESVLAAAAAKPLPTPAQASPAVLPARAP